MLHYATHACSGNVHDQVQLLLCHATCLCLRDRAEQSQLVEAEILHMQQHGDHVRMQPVHITSAPARAISAITVHLNLFQLHCKSVCADHATAAM